MAESLLPIPEESSIFNEEPKSVIPDYFFKSPQQIEAERLGSEPLEIADSSVSAMADVVANRDIDPEPSISTKETNRQSLEQTGQQQQENSLRQELENIAARTDIDINLKREIATKAFESKGAPQSLRETYLKAITENAVISTTDESAVIQSLIDQNQDALAEHYRTIREGKQGAFIEGLAPLVDKENLTNSAVVDFAVQALAPMTYASPIVSVIKQVMPELEVGASDHIFMGDIRQEFNARARALPVEEQAALIKNLSRAISEYKFAGTDNDFIKQEMAKVLFDWKEGGWGENLLDDIFGVLDFAALAGTVRGGAKTIIRGGKGVKLSKGQQALQDMVNSMEELRVFEDSILGMTSAAAPTKAVDLAEQALRNPQVARTIAGGQERVVVETILPKMADAPKQVNVSLNNRGFFSVGFAEPELEKVANNIRQSMDVVTGKGKLAHILPNNTYFEITGDGVRGEFMLNATEQSGWTDLAHAELIRNTIDGLFRSFNYDLLTAEPVVKIYGRNMAKNIYEEIKPVVKGETRPPYADYRIGVAMEEKLLPRHALAVEAVKPGKVTGRWAQWFDKSAWGTSWLNRGTNQAFERFSGRVKEYRQMIQPLFKMKKSTVRKVFTILDEGDRDHIEYTLNDLKNMHGQDPDFQQIVSGYFLARKLQDAIYSTMNKGYRNKLLSQGYKEVRYLQEGRGESIILEGDKIIARHVDPSSLNDLIKPVTMDVDAIDDVTGAAQTTTAHVYDIDQDIIRPITMDDVIAANNQQLHVLESLRPIRQKQSINEIHYIVRKNSSKNSKIDRLPEYVLRKWPGYITRAYDIGYLVRMKYKTKVNGVQTVERYKVVGVEATIDRAHAVRNMLLETEFQKTVGLEKANAGLSGRTLSSEDLDKIRKSVEDQFDDVRRSDEFDISEGERYYDPLSTEWLDDTGHLYTSTRRPSEIKGAMETDETGDMVTNRARRLVTSVSDSILRGIHSAARVEAIEPTINKLVGNWEASYGDLFKETTNGKFPWGIKPSAPKNMKPADQARYDRAIALQNYIKEIAGVNESRIQAAMRNSIIRISENLLMGKPAHWKTALADGLFKARNLNVIDKIKSIAFFQLITMRPLRQAILQASQASLYLNRGDYGKYFASGEGAIEFSGIWMGLLSKSLGNFDSTKGFISQRMGMTEKEYEETIQAYIDSGLPASIDSHMWLEHSSLDRNLYRLANELAKYPKFNDAVQAPRDLVNHTHKWIRRVGFDLGEQTQLLGAFLAEKRAWELANPNAPKGAWRSDRNLAMIAGDARTLSGNMNRAGTLAMQKGFTGLLLQFMSHSTKMAQMLAPTHIGKWKLPGLSKIANEHISNREKFRMFVTQMMLYGTGGLGLSSIYEEVAANVTSATGEQVPQDVSMIVEEGIMGTLLNMGIRLIEGDIPFTTDERDPNTTDLEISKNLSPWGGAPLWSNTNPFAVILGYFMDTDTSVKDIMGPGFQTITRMYEGIPTFMHIMGDASYLDTDEKIEAALVNLSSSLLLETDTWFKSRYEHAVGRYLSRRGNQTVKATSSEIFSKTLMGIRSRKSRQVTDVNLSVEGVYGGYTKDPNEDLSDLKQQATRDFNQIRRVMELLNKHEIERGDFENAVRHMAELNYLSMDSREHAIYQTALYTRMANWVTEDTAENQLIKNFVRVYGSASTDPMEDMYSRIRNMNNFENRELFIEQLKDRM